MGKTPEGAKNGKCAILKKSYSEPIFNVWYHLGIKESATVSLPSNHEPLNRKLPRKGQQIEQIHF